MSSLKVIIPLVIIFILGVAGVYAIYKSQMPKVTDLVATSANPQAVNFPKNSPAPTPVATPTVQGSQVQPNTGSNDLEIKNIGITLDMPIANQKISSPQVIRGKANVTSQKVVVQIKDSTGQILGKSQASACVGLDACSFETSIIFSSPLTPAGTVEIFSPSAIDANPTYTTSIAVSF